MYKHILPITLRERLFMVCDSYFTYSDAYVSVIQNRSSSDDIWDEGKTIRPVKYFIIEQDELAPLSELVKEKVYFFTEQQFKYHPARRKEIYEIMIRFIHEHGTTDEEDVDALVKELFMFIDLGDMYFMHDYEEEIREYFNNKARD